MPGKRISILAVERGLSPDRAITDLEVTLPPPYVNDAWPQAGGTSAHAMYHLQLGDEPKRDWKSDVGEGSGDDRHILAQPLVVDGTVYTMDARSLITAFDSETGRRLWRTDIELDEEDGGYFGGGLAYEDGRLFVTTGFAIAFALDAGSRRGPVGSSPFTGAYPGGPHGQRRAGVHRHHRQPDSMRWPPTDGRRLWEHTQASRRSAGLLGNASPAVAGSTVIVPYYLGGNALPCWWRTAVCCGAIVLTGSAPGRSGRPIPGADQAACR